MSRTLSYHGNIQENTLFYNSYVHINAIAILIALFFRDLSSNELTTVTKETLKGLKSLEYLLVHCCFKTMLYYFLCKTHFSDISLRQFMPRSIRYGKNEDTTRFLL